MSRLFDQLAKVTQGMADALNFNQATLSGAIDIIVVQHADGTMVSTPFHVRFGKLQLLKSREKMVTIEVNGKKADFCMKLGKAGEAFFVLAVEEQALDIDADGEWMTSPMASPIGSPVSSPTITHEGTKIPEFDLSQSRIDATRQRMELPREEAIVEKLNEPEIVPGRSILTQPDLDLAKQHSSQSRASLLDAKDLNDVASSRTHEEEVSDEEIDEEQAVIEGMKLAQQFSTDEVMVDSINKLQKRKKQRSRPPKRVIGPKPPSPHEKDQLSHLHNIQRQLSEARREHVVGMKDPVEEIKKEPIVGEVPEPENNQPPVPVIDEDTRKLLEFAKHTIAGDPAPGAHIAPPVGIPDPSNDHPSKSPNYASGAATGPFQHADRAIKIPTLQHDDVEPGVTIGIDRTKTEEEKEKKVEKQEEKALEQASKSEEKAMSEEKHVNNEEKEKHIKSEEKTVVTDKEQKHHHHKHKHHHKHHDLPLAAGQAETAPIVPCQVTIQEPKPVPKPPTSTSISTSTPSISTPSTSTPSASTTSTSISASASTSTSALSSTSTSTSAPPPSSSSTTSTSTSTSTSIPSLKRHTSEEDEREVDTTTYVDGDGNKRRSHSLDWSQSAPSTPRSHSAHTSPTHHGKKSPGAPSHPSPTVSTTHKGSSIVYTDISSSLSQSSTSSTSPTRIRAHSGSVDEILMDISSPSSPRSDGEGENASRTWSWGWGGLPVRTRGFKKRPSHQHTSSLTDIPPITAPVTSTSTSTTNEKGWMRSIFGMFKHKDGRMTRTNNHVVIDIDGSRTPTMGASTAPVTGRTSPAITSRSPTLTTSTSPTQQGTSTSTPFTSLQLPSSAMAVLAAKQQQSSQPQPQPLHSSMSSPAPLNTLSTSSTITSSASSTALISLNDGTVSTDVQPPSSPIGPIELSLCGDKLGDEHESNLRVFQQYAIDHQQLCIQPEIVFSSNLVLKYGDRFYPARIALPLLLSQLAFQKPLHLNEETLMALSIDKAIPEGGDKSKSPKKVTMDPNTSRGGWRDWFRRGKPPAIDTSQPTTIDTVAPSSLSSASPAGSTVSSPTGSTTSTSSYRYERDSNAPSDYDHTSTHMAYRKALRPTDEMLKSLGLKSGRNSISFSVSSKLQGTQTVNASIYVWAPDTKIVISDVDGTITKSDVLGNFLPLVGKDWSHLGVTNLYSSIQKHGYQILYLTSRAIGQANITRGYLHNLRQGPASLPEGPVIMSPDRLMHSFKREVIYRKPQEFKIIALRDVRHLFHDDHNPFYAGFGNRITDIIAYRAVGVPVSKIFIINPSGHIGHINNTYLKSYPELATLVDSMFPPRDAHSSTDAEYNQFNYWRDPIPTIDDDEDEENGLSIY